MDIAILLHDRVTALDAVGPYEVLSRMPGARVHFVGTRPGPVRADEGLGLHVDRALDELPRPDIVLVPGSSSPAVALNDDALLAWVRTAHGSAAWTTSVCSGSLVLAAAGVLAGRRATTHWIAMDHLRALGAVPVPERIVVDGTVVTAAGVSAGIDLALRLAALIHGDETAEALQLAIEYDPQPPFPVTAYTATPAQRRTAGLLIGGSASSIVD
ncbi:DJ-1/PfpI family protein [Rugosimonospora africana]|uniref:Glutamine amidotransferase n=1 Tax=Rugosimonospora africana TaxID=556532 RepID=A0A8J3R0T2_9ACTN|nr:DJ-1/PfpI family protein [Rugosimonospora africana]GIH20116.1 glutamine amidotransferase [Rugosimonospora africana]